MSVADINTKVAEAVAAIESGDYQTAYTKLLAAKALIASKPDQTRQGDGMRWDRAAIDALLAEVKSQISLSTASSTNSRGVVRQKVRYTRPTSTNSTDQDGYCV